MDEQQNQSQNVPDGQEDAWHEVGRQFQELGESLAKAFRSAVNDPDNQRRVKQMQSGLEAMVSEVSQAIKSAADSPEGQKVRTGAEKAAGEVRTAAGQAFQEARPQLLSALHSINSELQKLIDRMESRREPPPEEPQI